MTDDPSKPFTIPGGRSERAVSTSNLPALRAAASAYRKARGDGEEEVEAYRRAVSAWRAAGGEPEAKRDGIHRRGLAPMAGLALGTLAAADRVGNQAHAADWSLATAAQPEGLAGHPADTAGVAARAGGLRADRGEALAGLVAMAQRQRHARRPSHHP